VGNGVPVVIEEKPHTGGESRCYPPHITPLRELRGSVSAY